MRKHTTILPFNYQRGSKASVEKLRASVDGLTPKVLFNQLSEYVIGNDDLKKQMSVALYNQYKRAHVQGALTAPKSTILLMGKTGCGKSFLATTGANLINVPFHTVDCSSLVSAGIVGNHLSDMAFELGRVKGADCSIVVLDEFDKLANTGGSHHSTAEVQEELLKAIEGTTLFGNGQGVEPGKFKLATNNIMFILAGAFSEINAEDEAVVRKMGFLGGEEKLESTNDPLIKRLAKYGILPELLGRITFIGRVSAMSKEVLSNIIHNKHGVFNAYKNSLIDEGINLVLTKDGEEALIDKVLATNTGARALTGALERLLVDIQFELIGERSLHDVELTKDLISKITL